MNMFKKNEGFTLVELIVVIAILAILAAVAVPAYSGYIAKAQEATIYTQLDSAKTAIAFAVAEEDPAFTVTQAEVVFADLDAVSVELPDGYAGDFDGEVDITEYVSAIDAGNTDYVKATLADGKWTLSK